MFGFDKSDGISHYDQKMAEFCNYIFQRMLHCMENIEVLWNVGWDNKPNLVWWKGKVIEIAKTQNSRTAVTAVIRYDEKISHPPSKFCVEFLLLYKKLTCIHDFDAGNVWKLTKFLRRYCDDTIHSPTIDWALEKNVSCSEDSSFNIGEKISNISDR